MIHLKAELDSSLNQNKVLDQDNVRWKERTQQILSKYEVNQHYIHQINEIAY